MMIEKIIQQAKELGFDNAVAVKTSEIVFDPSFRPYCEDNYCGQFAANYCCPPFCGTPDEMKERVLKYQNAVLLQMQFEIKDFSQKDKLKQAKNKHNGAMIKIIKKLKENGVDCLMMGSGGCSLCTPCNLSLSKPCPFVDLRYSCMSAYCVFVKKLAESCNINYDYKDGILPFFGLIAVN